MKIFRVCKSVFSSTALAEFNSQCHIIYIFKKNWHWVYENISCLQICIFFHSLGLNCVNDGAKVSEIACTWNISRVLTTG